MKNTRPTEMMILAGGLGTRLRPVLSDVPKPMAPINERPFLEYILDHWIDQGIKKFILSIGYLGEMIKNHFGEIEYVEESSPLGTGGALKLALCNTSWLGKYALLANGDTWFPVDLTIMFQDALKQVKPFTIALRDLAENDRYGSVQINEKGSVEAFEVISKGRSYINGGCYLFDVGIIRSELNEYPEAFSLEKDFLVPYAANGNVGSSIQNCAFLDIGVPHDYQCAIKVLG